MCENWNLVPIFVLYAIFKQKGVIIRTICYSGNRKIKGDFLIR